MRRGVKLSGLFFDVPVLVALSVYLDYSTSWRSLIHSALLNQIGFCQFAAKIRKNGLPSFIFII